MDILQQISDQIDLGDHDKVHELTTVAIEQQVPDDYCRKKIQRT